MSTLNLTTMGLTAARTQEAGCYPGLHLARVSVQHKQLYKVITAQGEITAELSGKLIHAVQAKHDYPAVGDWVMVDRLTDSNGHAIIGVILPRFSLLERKAAGTSQEGQNIAANIDTIFICMALNRDFNLRRLERYLALAWDSGALPAIVLTKADLCTELACRLSEVQAIASGVDVLVTSSQQPTEQTAILNYIKSGQTVAFIGSSGVGKSTLINHLAGQEVLATQMVSQQGKGRHTTTHRQLLVLPGGGIVIDTPGMRELQLETADLAKAFADIDQLTRRCRFADCSHQSEPGCAIKAAIADNSLPLERFLSYQKLQAELNYQGMNSRQLEQAKITRMFGSVGAMKEAHRAIKAKQKRR